MVAFDKFNSMPVDEKAWYVWNNSVFLIAREDDHFRYNLFYLNNYYVEIIYSFRTGEIEKIRAFFSETLLQDYLSEINISSLCK